MTFKIKRSVLSIRYNLHNVLGHRPTTVTVSPTFLNIIYSNICDSSQKTAFGPIFEIVFMVFFNAICLPFLNIYILDHTCHSNFVMGTVSNIH